MLDSVMNCQRLDLAICPNPIFVIGSPRSGTSILPWALAQHSELWTSRESDILYHLFGHRRAEKAFQKAVGRPDETWLLHNGVGQTEFLGYLGLGLNALFTSRSQGKRWIDQTPLYTLMVDTLAELFPGAQFLHVLRDGRRVVHSMIHFCNLLSDDLRAQFVKSGQLPPWATDFRDACKNWRLFAETSMNFAAHHPDRCLTLRNEELLSDTEDRFREIFRFLSLPYEQAPILCFRSTRMNSSFPHLDADKPPALQRRPDPWQEWSTEQKRIFVEEAGAALVKYGMAGADELAIPDANGAAEPISSPGPYFQLVSRIRDVIQNKLPSQAQVIVVSKGDDGLLKLSAKIGWHFPQTGDGAYSGYYPVDSRTAIEQLEQLREKGGNYVLFPGTSFWWLDHYQEFHQHLESHYQRIWRDDSCLIYELAGPPSTTHSPAVGGEGSLRAAEAGSP
jgi:hypothetical protein